MAAPIISTATIAQLKALPGIGDWTAQWYVIMRAHLVWPMRFRPATWRYINARCANLKSPAGKLKEHLWH
jgi:hypothetical protein